MRISKIYFAGFGRFVDWTISLSPGLNIIQAPNESGKSTLISGLVSLLYGIKREGVRMRKEVQWYKQYMPWASSQYAGEITYSIRGKNFRLLRKLSLSDDLEQLIDLDNKREITHTFPMDRRKDRKFLESQLKLSRQEFMRISLMTTGENIGERKDLLLTEKLKQILNHGHDLNVTEAIKKIEKQIEIIGLRKGEHTKLGRQLLITEGLSHEVIQLHRYTEDYTKLLQDLNVIKLKLETLHKERIENISQIEQLKEILAGYEMISNIENEISSNKRYIDNYDRLVVRKSDLVLQQISPSIYSGFAQMNWPLIILLFILLIVGGKVFSLEYRDIIFMMVCMLAGFSVHALYNKRSLKLDQEKKSLINSTIFSETELMLAQYAAGEIEACRDKQVQLQTKIHILKKDIEHKVAELGLENSHVILKHTLQDAETKLSGIEGRYIKLRSEADRVEGSLGSLGNLIQLLSIKETEWNRSKEIVAELRDERYQLELAKEYLAEAASDLRSVLGPRLVPRLSYWISKLTGGRYKDVILDAGQTLSVKIFSEEFSSYCDLDMLSRGTIDQALLALRFTLLELCSEHTNISLPLIIDEGLVYFDDKRLRQAILSLQELLCYHQILLCTCHDREINLLDELGIEYNLIKIDV